MAPITPNPSISSIRIIGDDTTIIEYNFEGNIQTTHFKDMNVGEIRRLEQPFIGEVYNQGRIPLMDELNITSGYAYEINIDLIDTIKFYGKHYIYEILRSQAITDIKLNSVGDNIILLGTSRIKFGYMINPIDYTTPENLFKNHPEIDDFRQAFLNLRVPNIEDVSTYPELPYDLLEDGTKQYLWNRQGKPGYPAPINGNGCFPSFYRNKYQYLIDADPTGYIDSWFYKDTISA